jgi:hypothetical protein
MVLATLNPPKKRSSITLALARIHLRQGVERIVRDQFAAAPGEAWDLIGCGPGLVCDCFSEEAFRRSEAKIGLVGDLQGSQPGSSRFDRARHGSFGTGTPLQRGAK